MVLEYTVVALLLLGSTWHLWCSNTTETPLSCELSLSPHRTHESIRCFRSLLAHPLPTTHYQLETLQQAMRAAAHPDHGADQLLPRLEYLLGHVDSAALLQRLEKLERHLPPDDSQLQWCFTVSVSLLRYMQPPVNRPSKDRP